MNGNPGKANYFIFFRDEKDAWSDGLPFGPEINMKGSAALSSFVSPDGKYLFFAARSDIWWVDAKVIEALKEKTPGTTVQTGTPNIQDAVAKGDLGRVKEILAKIRQLNSRDFYDRTPLIQALLAKQEAIFNLLVEQGADINLVDKEGMSAIVLAVFLGADGPVKRLIEKGAELDSNANVLGLTPLHAAARAGWAKSAELLLAKGARLDVRDAQGRTPLLLAAFYGRADLAGMLIAKGASIGDRDELGSTALHLAALNGHKEIVDLLISKGASLNDRNLRNGTPLSIAVREGHEEIVKALITAGAQQSSLSLPLLKGEYLGQEKPGLKPLIFAPGVISTEKDELNSVFTPDGGEFYFTIRTAQGLWKIMVLEQKNGEWTKPRTASFSGSYSDVDLFISPDGKKLYFCSNRPPEGKGQPWRSYDIWVTERKGAGWSDPVNMGAPVNSAENEFYPVVTKDATLYFQSWRSGSRGGRDIYRAKLENGIYLIAESIGEPVSGDLAEGDALVAPDESFIILSISRADGFGQGDLYASFRGPEGAWTEPRNLGAAINTKANENCPILSPDGKFLFYTSGGDIYWVSSESIERLRRK